MLGKFQLPASVPSGPELALNTNSLNTPSNAEALHYGDYTYDMASGRYNISWNSWAEMQASLRKEQEENVFELSVKWDRPPNQSNPMEIKWTKEIYFNCAQNGTGGDSQYEKKHPEWDRKVESK